MASKVPNFNESGLAIPYLKIGVKIYQNLFVLDFIYKKKYVLENFFYVK